MTAETQVSPESLPGGSDPWAFTSGVSSKWLELRKGYLDETKEAGPATGRKGRAHGFALGSWGGGEALSASHRVLVHYKHCNLVSASALIKGPLDTLRPLQITD